jgi:hypothetical protein
MVIAQQDTQRAVIGIDLIGTVLDRNLVLSMGMVASPD